MDLYLTSTFDRIMQSHQGQGHHGGLQNGHEGHFAKVELRKQVLHLMHGTLLMASRSILNHQVDKDSEVEASILEVSSH
jgi:hypothetical protein